MTKVSKEKFFQKSKNIDEYLKYLDQIKKELKGEKDKFINDFHFYGLVERYLQLAIQTFIDSVAMLIINLELEKPENNQEAISLLYNHGIISADLAERLEGMIGFRNILVHEYDDIDREKVYEFFISRLDDLKDFQKALIKYLN